MVNKKQVGLAPHIGKSGPGMSLITAFQSPLVATSTGNCFELNPCPYAKMFQASLTEPILEIFNLIHYTDEAE